MSYVSRLRLDEVFASSGQRLVFSETNTAAEMKARIFANTRDPSQAPESVRLSETLMAIVTKVPCFACLSARFGNDDVRTGTSGIIKVPWCSCIVWVDTWVPYPPHILPYAPEHNRGAATSLDFQIDERTYSTTVGKLAGERLKNPPAECGKHERRSFPMCPNFDAFESSLQTRLNSTPHNMAPAKCKSAEAASSSQSDEVSQQPSQEMLQIESDTLAQIAQMQNAKAGSGERWQDCSC